MTQQEATSITTVPKEEPKKITVIPDSPEHSHARELARRLRYMVANGKKLNDDEIWALAQYAASTDLNPFNGECYYIPTVGPTKGILGCRKKANEQLEREAEKYGIKGCHIWLDTRPSTRQEANFDEGVDVAMHVTLHDWVTHNLWRKSILETAKELHSIGVQDSYQEAQKLVGPEPVWEADGIVFADEKFSFGGNPEKFIREERAIKRAEKLAILKRFPRLAADEPQAVLDGKVTEMEPSSFKMMNEPSPEILPDSPESPQLESTPNDENKPPWEIGGDPEPKKSIEESMVELGFPPDK